ncbi:dickkopf-related protein 3b [Salvelinus fontinalis]|uniref:dickkopf-related protein 3b n=1 Tax=Salvelinus fontinalis TaxID=8038 RepID=UPI002486BC00|nr:dickkopf-related protein 3b [Salvelinus fontinalis]
MSGPTTRMMQVAALTFCLCLGNGISSPKTIPDIPITGVSFEDHLNGGHATLKDIFREVEMLMEDTQHVLEEAVEQMVNESAKSLLNIQDLLPNYHNETSTYRDNRNHTVYNAERIDKETDNRTGGTHFQTHIEINGQWNEVEHECMLDEDCGKNSYCLYEIVSSKCLPCRDVDMTCTKDEECCSDQMCVWGQCTKNATKGNAGCICQYQSDCKPKHCCAILKELLFPVCQPRPDKGEACNSHPNLLMDMLSWDVEGPREYCLCAGGLHCQPHGRGSLCVN